jgi:SAM-dependent methyltransferase
MSSYRDYPLSADLDRENRRLGWIEQRYDDGTRRRLAALGLAPGWRCLELGPGRGSVATWMADRVRPQGSVLALDLDMRIAGRIDHEHVEVREHDLRVEELPRDEFDLVHSRAVLMHLEERDALLDRIAQSLRPGGRVLLEEGDSFPLSTIDSPAAHRVLSTILGRFDWSRRLPERLEARGFTVDEAVVEVEYFAGRSFGAQFWEATIERRIELMEPGMLDPDDVAQTYEWLRTPGRWMMTMALFCVSARLP